MVARNTLKLEHDSRAQLRRIVRRAIDWHEREPRRVHCCYWTRGVFAEEVARQMGLGAPTLHITHTRWRQSVMSSPADLPAQRSAQKTPARAC